MSMKLNRPFKLFIFWHFWETQINVPEKTKGETGSVCVCQRGSVFIWGDLCVLLKRSQQRFEAQQTTSSPKNETAGEEIRNELVPLSLEGPPRSGWEAPRAAHPSPQQEQVSAPCLPRHCAGAWFRLYHMVVCVTRSVAVVWWWGQQEVEEEQPTLLSACVLRR